MADPRETAQAWLAERIGWYFASDAGGNTAAAIAFSAISSDGVEVDTEHGVLVDGVFTPRPSAEEARREAEFYGSATVPWPTASRTLAQRVVIRLPAQPIGKTT